MKRVTQVLADILAIYYGVARVPRDGQRANSSRLKKTNNNKHI
jgi:hypothetical protein